MKADCFAYVVKENPAGQYIYCSALNDMLCEKSSDCPFYKNRKKWEKEVMRINGTTNFRVMGRRYAETHEGGD